MCLASSFRLFQIVFSFISKWFTVSMLRVSVLLRKLSRFAFAMFDESNIAFAVHVGSSAGSSRGTHRPYFASGRSESGMRARGSPRAIFCPFFALRP
jgi:hypothetical protein